MDMSSENDDVFDHDFLFKQGKIRKGTTLKEYITAALLIVIGIPLLAMILIPLALITFLIRHLIEYIKTKDDATITTNMTSNNPPFLDFQPINMIPPSDRQYDIILYGASGFVGRLVTQYLIKHYLTKESQRNNDIGLSNNKPIQFAISGRTYDTLESSLHHAMENIPIASLLSPINIIIAECDDIESLRHIVNNTRIIISTVGPYTQYGNNLVGLCATYGTHYCDLTGETTWVRHVIDKYELTAKQSGAIITHHCGNDCVPWDLSVLSAVKSIKNGISSNNNEYIKCIHVYDRVNGSFSGGTIASMINRYTDYTHDKYILSYDPLLSYYRQDIYNNSISILRNNNIYIPLWSSMISSWVGPFVMSGVISHCIKRSNAILGYSKPVQYTRGQYNNNNNHTMPNTQDQDKYLEYKERYVYKSFCNAIIVYLTMSIFQICLLIPLLPSLISYLKPPGTGPSIQEQLDGYLHVYTRVYGTQGSVQESVVYIPRDSGYLETATMISECAITLLSLYNQGNLPEPGIWTPAISMGKHLQERLEKANFIFKTRQYQDDDATQLESQLVHRQPNI